MGTSIRTVATHDVTQSLHPRPVTPENEVGKVEGIAIDRALSEYSHQFARGRHPTKASIERLAAEVLHEQLEEADLVLPSSELERIRGQLLGVLRAFRKSELFGLARPRSRVILIGEAVGVYAQPDYWDGRARFYEMKSYRAEPVPPDVALQMRLFQLAFPECIAHLASFDRHADPVSTTIVRWEPPTESERRSVLEAAWGVAEAQGTEKILEFLDAPVVRYARPPP